MTGAAVSRRTVLRTGLQAGLGAAMFAAATACTSEGPDRRGSGAAGASGSTGATGPATAATSAASSSAATPPSTRASSFTPAPLAPGQRPPQLVVISWDGAGNLPSGEMDRFLTLAGSLGASMTFFLSGIYFLPESQRTDYRPPHRAPGSSAIGFLSDTSLRRTVTSICDAWQAGHEIGTHFNGHFCGPGGVGSWSSEDWRSEIDQAVDFVTNVKSRTGFSDLPDLPFDYTKELIGSRTPCLEGRDALLPTAKALGWRYDSSGTRRQVWPSKNSFGLWDLSMHSVPFRGQREVITMDYNFMYQQSGPGAKGTAAAATPTTPGAAPSKPPSQATPGDMTKGDPAQFDAWRAETVDSLMAGITRSYEGNRAPVVIGNHFERWNGGIYMDAVATVMERAAQLPDLHLISFRQLCDYLDLQTPATLAKLQALPVGAAPTAGWASL